MPTSEWIAALWSSSRHYGDRRWRARADHALAKLSTRWGRPVVYGWRMQRSLANSLRSLRPIKADLSLPLRRMSKDELQASLLYFSRFAHLFGTPDELVSQAAEAVTEAHTRVNRRGSE